MCRGGSSSIAVHEAPAPPQPPRSLQTPLDAPWLQVCGLHHWALMGSIILLRMMRASSCHVALVEEKIYLTTASVLGLPYARFVSH